MLHLLCQFFPSAAIPLSVHHACKRACTHSGIGTWWQATCPTTWSVSGAEFTPKTGASRWSPSGALNVLRKTQTRAVSHHFDSLRIFDPPLLHHASSTWCRCRSSRKGWMDSRSFWHLLPDAHGMMHTSMPMSTTNQATNILPHVFLSKSRSYRDTPLCAHLQSSQPPSLRFGRSLVRPCQTQTIWGSWTFLGILGHSWALYISYSWMFQQSRVSGSCSLSECKWC